ncbi:MAG TPA: hypothetical protein VMZ74_09260 [Ramlibacter sp.]|nr:hypothetical protein [Ramlibacter sp.]
MNTFRAAACLALALAPLAAGAASPFDGYWMRVNADKSLDPASQVEFRVEKAFVIMNTPQGASYRARADGTDAPMANNPNTTSVSVKLEGKTLVQTEKNNGKAWYVTTMELEGDGNTAKVSWKNLKNNQGGSYTLSKQ